MCPCPATHLNHPLSPLEGRNDYVGLLGVCPPFLTQPAHSQPKDEGKCLLRTSGARRNLLAAAGSVRHPGVAVSTTFLLSSGQAVLFRAHLAGQQLAVSAVRALRITRRVEGVPGCGNKAKWGEAGMLCG